MLKIGLAAIWLGVNLRSLVQIVRKNPGQVHIDKGSTSVASLIFNLRSFLSQPQADVIKFLDQLKAQPDVLCNFRKALYLTALGLVVEVVLYGAITISFESWAALAFGALVLASHLQSIMLLVMLAVLVSNWQWFVLTFKKMQVLTMPVLLLEILWLAYLVFLWS